MKIKKVVLITLAVIVLAAVAFFSVVRSQANVTAVTTAEINRSDLVSIVSGTGQIKPKTYVNIGATAFGRITHLYVKEGDSVKAGTTLATIENVQPSATVAAQQATIASSRTDVSSFTAAEQTAQANIAAAQADLEQRRLDFTRAEALYDDKLIAKQDFDAKKAIYDSAQATLQQRQATSAQARAQTASQRAKVNQAIASQRSNYDALDKTVSRAPFNGLVTNVPVREGETVVLGIQNAEGSTLMTLADMSIITAEVKVDETDIVNVKLGQAAEVSVDALPGRIFKGHVTAVGDQALLRTTGVATSQSTTGTEEAKDFKVVITLDNVNGQNNGELRPGLSTTAKIVTASRPGAIVVPIQALVQRDPLLEKQLEENKNRKGSSQVKPVSSGKGKLTQGVYVVQGDGRKRHVYFTAITTGVTGATDMEVLSGLSPSQTIVTGRYRTLRDLHSGQLIKQDTSADAPTDTAK